MTTSGVSELFIASMDFLIYSVPPVWRSEFSNYYSNTYCPIQDRFRDNSKGVAHPRTLGVTVQICFYRTLNNNNYVILIQWHSYTGYMINETMRNKELVGVVIDLSLFRSWGAHSVVPCCSSVPIELQAVNSDIRYWPLDRQWHWLIELQRGCCDNN